MGEESGVRSSRITVCVVLLREGVRGRAPSYSSTRLFGQSAGRRSGVGREAEIMREKRS